MISPNGQHLKKVSLIGSWELNLETYNFKCSNEIYRIIGVDNSYHLNIINVWHFISLDEKSIVKRHIYEAIHEKKQSNFVHRILRRDGEFCYVRQRLRCLFDKIGNPICLLGTIQNFTEEYPEDHHLSRNKQLYRCLFTLNQDATFAIDLNGMLIDVNPAASVLTGYPIEDLLHTNFIDLIMPDDIEKGWLTYQEVLQEKIQNFDISLKHKAGHPIHIQGSALPIIIDNQVTGVIGIARDISQLVKTEKQLLVSQEQLQSIFNNVDVVLWSHDYTTGVHVCSPNVEKIFGVSADSFIQNPMMWKEMTHPDDLEQLELSEQKYSQGMSITRENRIIRPNGEIRWVHQRITHITDATGQKIRSQGVTIDITERKQAEAKLHYIAYHDTLTDLPNRRNFEEKLQFELDHARMTNQQIAVMYLDLDRFKFINDTLGHHIGDRLMQEIGKRLMECIRQEDTLARLGGDEFTVILPNIQTINHAITIAQSIVDSSKQPLIINDYELYITTSIGISLYPMDGEDSLTLIKHADMALYQAKEKGKNNFQLYCSSMNSKTHKTFTFGNDLYKALKREEFELYYQPRIDLKTKRINGAEALLRWNHPKRGKILPGEFISITEETGLIIPIGEWVLHSACKQNKAWQQAGLPPIPLSVNLSTRQLLEKGLVEKVKHIIGESGLCPSWIELEITESSLMQNEDYATILLHQLKELGIKISLDDFGTGYSSLAYLNHFKLDTLKIDRSFIKDISVHSKHTKVTTAIIHLAHNLNMDVVAEGVETEEQIHFLQKHDCRTVQGYYFSPPLPIHEFQELLRKQG